MNWSSIPLPLKIAIAVISSLVLLILATKMHSLVVIAAVVAWVVVLGSLLYSAGLINGVEKIPYVGGLIVKISIRNHSNCPHSKNDATEKAGAPNLLKPEDRISLLKRGRSKLDELKLIKSATDDIFENIIKPAESCIKIKRPALGDRPVWIALIYGPPGIGKSSIVNALADILVGLNAVTKNNRERLERPVPGHQHPNWVQTLNNGINGIVIADNAEWMAEKNTVNHELSNYRVFLNTASSLADNSPGKHVIIIAMTMTEKNADEEVGLKPNQHDIVRNVTIQKIKCEPISRESLYEVFSKKINENGISIEQNLIPRMIKIIETAMKYEFFAYINTMGEWAGYFLVHLSDKGKNIITKDDLDWFQDKINRSKE